MSIIFGCIHILTITALIILGIIYGLNGLNSRADSGNSKVDSGGGLLNCTWASWTKWATCSATCKGGIQLRSRYVEKTAQNGGTPCSGESAEHKACGTAACEGERVCCGWTSLPLTTWGACIMLGQGVQLRSRLMPYSIVLLLSCILLIKRKCWRCRIGSVSMLSNIYHVIIGHNTLQYLLFGQDQW